MMTRSLPVTWTEFTLLLGHFELHSLPLAAQGVAQLAQADRDGLREPECQPLARPTRTRVARRAGVTST